MLVNFTARLVLKWWGRTHCLDVHPLPSEILICSNTGEALTTWMHIHPSLSAWVVQRLEQLTRWMCVHPNDPILVSHGGSYPLDHWRGLTNWMLCLPILISGSDLVKQWRGTHSLDACSPILVWSNQALERHSHSGCIITQSHQWFWSNTGEELTSWMSVCVQV